MKELLMIISICSFIANLGLLIGTITGASVFLKVITKVISLFGTIAPIIYWFKLLNII